MIARSRSLAYQRRQLAERRARIAALGLLVPAGWVEDPRPGCCPRCDLLSRHGLCGYCLAELAAEVAPLTA
jgi:hypothetical protein